MKGAAAPNGAWMQVRTKSVSAHIVAQIRDRLFSGELVPGQFLGSERKLSAEFGVSRVTMRDALRILEATGIVEVKIGKGGGVRVGQPNLERIAESLAIQLRLSGITLSAVFDAQIGVEVHAAKLATANATDAEIKALEAQLKDLSAAQLRPAEFVERSQDLHVAVTRASHNEALASMYEALSHLARPFMIAGTTAARIRRVIGHHGKVLSALKERDAEKVGAVVMSHLQLLVDAHLRSITDAVIGPPQRRSKSQKANAALVTTNYAPTWSAKGSRSAK
jgi:GntR family transcriptional regulator, transcriptional repressor for pyruvate dehydrogenase complex